MATLRSAENSGQAVISSASSSCPFVTFDLVALGTFAFVVGGAVTKFRNAGKESNADNDKSKGKS